MEGIPAIVMQDVLIQQLNDKGVMEPLTSTQSTFDLAPCSSPTRKSVRS